MNAFYFNLKLIHFIKCKYIYAWYKINERKNSLRHCFLNEQMHLMAEAMRALQTYTTFTIYLQRTIIASVQSPVIRVIYTSTHMIGRTECSTEYSPDSCSVYWRCIKSWYRWDSCCICYVEYAHTFLFICFFYRFVCISIITAPLTITKAAKEKTHTFFSSRF